MSAAADNLLLSLPIWLLERLWPGERAVVGMRVCKQLHEQLVSSRVTLARFSYGMKRETLRTDLFRLVRAKLWLRWDGDSWDLLRAIEESGCSSALHGLTLRKGKFNVGELQRVLNHCSKTLSHLHLSETGLLDAGAVELAQVIGSCKSLEHLALPANWICKSGAAMLGHVLGQCDQLKHLDMAFNSIGAEGLEKLAEGFVQCASLTHLDLGRNELGSAGARKLADVLVGCKSLTHLNLLGNEIGPEGAERLGEVLGHCAQLCHLNLSMNTFGDRATEKIAHVFRSCPALRQVYLGDNQIGGAGEQALRQLRLERGLQLQLSW